MNLLVANLASNPSALPYGNYTLNSLNPGAALERLASANPVASMQVLQTQTQAMLEMATQMMSILTQLMLGQPGSQGQSASILGQPVSTGQTGPLNNSEMVNNGGRIKGGKALYGGKGMFHKGKSGAPDSYAFENSPAGIQFAAQHGYKSIDIDMQITKDGVPVATHWSKPMAKDGFYDPLGQLKSHTKVSEMTLAEVMRLRNKDGQSQIYPVASMVGELKKNGIAAVFEAKDDNRFANPQMMTYLGNLVRDAGIHANMTSIDRGPRSLEILEAAQRAGFWTRFASASGKHGRSLGDA